MLVDFIIDNKWYFFIAGEVVFWGSIIGSLLFRYVFNRSNVSRNFILLWLFSDVWLLSLGVLDYLKTGHFDSFQIIIIIAVIYGLTEGKKDIKKLDRFVSRMKSKWQS